ncbi:minor capsid protein [Listeria monocytogenes]|uniref:phage minor capsid protein n=1 Tax=Listeria monocytogenes TaxID=1639 RepID=UPI00073AFC93|nr:phage minor capsid protein [Listeria monocytogenes]EEP3938640.1 minor capsid protein [Listeria monocytogenes serotype 1/2b]EAC2876347.1 minor capsid protein [Listeria monocytogenes]EAC9251220.1 minor capsid protein [Listeria monocytogenes]EAC9263216.1 minor capsid protein [Listeria monocytogenes]EAD0223274.1 minor capsid protein [Listeria monocytogenes]
MSHHHAPVDFEKEASILRNHFNNAEIDLLLLIKKHVMHGAKNPTKWKFIQQSRLIKFKRELKAHISLFKDETRDKIDKLTYRVYLECVKEYEDEMEARYQTKKEVDIQNDDYLSESDALIQISEDIANYWQKIAPSKYKQVVKETKDNNGILKYAIATSLINVLGDGIRNVIDQSGRKYRSGAYMEMASRVAFFNVGLNAMKRVLGRYEHELVQVSAHVRSCPRCAPWQGEVLSVNYESNEYKTLQEAENDGLFHPNCHHFLYSYFEGDETDEPIPYDEEEYEAQSKQRYYERGIRDWKTKDILAEGPSKQYTAGKVKQWEEALQEHLNNNRFLERESDREIIKASK